MSYRIILEPIGFLRPGGIGAVRAALAAAKIVYQEGGQVVSLDTDGKVYCTPTDHDFSKEMLAKYADRVVGSYDQGAGASDICDDLRAQWDQDRAA